jgi:protein-tyrosine phosphatase
MRSPFYWLLGLSLALMLTVVPFIYYRWEYTHSKRLRVVTEDKVYRSGQMTASGFAEAVERYQIRTIINLQDEFPDPEIALGYFTRKTIKESELCRQLGVNYVFLGPDLISRKKIPQERPPAIDKFLALMDDPAIYPVLLHCRAGLHRTGVMVGVYRMEYEGWTREQAIEEMKNHGFGEWPCTTANDYITQYIDTFQRGIRNAPAFNPDNALRDKKWNNWIHHQ